jgi:type IV pilus assembly protein PilN
VSVRVNLLPWRAERRAAQRRHLGILAGMVAGLAVAIIVLGHVIIAGYISEQEGRNTFLKGENARLDKEIAEIDKLQEDIKASLARKQVIESLQADRSQVVTLLDQLVKQTPDGVYLKSLKQAGLKVNLTGYAQSNARVSTLMRNFASSPFLENPVLIEIKAASVNNKRVSEFNMNVSLKRTQTEDAATAKPAAAPAKAGAAK